VYGKARELGPEVLCIGLENWGGWGREFRVGGGWEADTYEEALKFYNTAEELGRKVGSGCCHRAELK
jgi:hypothetical protein